MLLKEMQLWWRLTIHVVSIKKILLIPSPTSGSANLCPIHFVRDLCAFRNDGSMIWDCCFETVHMIRYRWIFFIVESDCLMRKTAKWY